jgi:phage gpG-like protein
MRVEVTLEYDKVSPQLAKLVRWGRTGPLLEKIGAALVKSTKKRFVTKSGLEGIPWQDNAPLTIEKKGFNWPLTDTGYLGDESLGYEVQEPLTVWVETDFTFPGGVEPVILQLGGWSGKNRQTYIPPRPFLGADSEDIKTIETLIWRRIKRMVGAQPL